MKEVVLDTETTGLSVKDGHRIVEIGCIELDDLIPTKKIFHCYLNPERKVSESALKVHGYTDNFLSDKKKFLDVADEFLKFVDGKKIIIHNAEFDIAHLNNELSLINKNLISKDNVIDTLEIARNKFPGSSISLDALCKRFKIDNSRRIKHTAIIDCELLSKVYINLIDQKEPLFQFKEENENININLTKTNNYSKKIIKITKDEYEKHKNFLKTDLKKNFF
ncbi:DNA polymerase III subunit epsilon [Candidatus Pelagibacter sp.]|nr:DNA polymerase III subunit epsilon [Candidatus Pelagibacter sp.]|tara:strand:+ start:2612 stop:3277 length:666 start_codon:yes stop_codon:yes gene_type:complete